MACSFHQTGEFNPAKSSLKIVEREDRQGYSLLLIEEGEGTVCDGCKGRKTFLCMDYCKVSGDLEEIIKKFLARREGREKGKSSEESGVAG